ncbi:MAG: DUF1365 domain-containing protein [Woeseia sp.]|nr:DUF1365 domain-containing protein [Woeseia sp.]
MDSCIFEGQVRHTRRRPVLHRFRYRVFMMYLDLDELPALFKRRWLWSTRRTAVARFRREDHLGDPDSPLKAAVEDLVESYTGRRPSGPIRLLTHLRYFGYGFNPVSFYYCFDESDTTVETIVAEVNNTPWGEQYCYVLPATIGHNDKKSLRFSPSKMMHVSPFMDMAIDYDWRFVPPTDALRVFMANNQDGARIFDAVLALRRREITGPSLARVLIQYPLMTVRIITAIHWQALKLWLKRVPLYAHPSKQIKTVSHR